GFAHGLPICGTRAAALRRHSHRRIRVAVVVEQCRHGEPGAGLCRGHSLQHYHCDLFAAVLAAASDLPGLAAGSSETRRLGDSCAVLELLLALSSGLVANRYEDGATAAPAPLLCIEPLFCQLVLETCGAPARNGY